MTRPSLFGLFRGTRSFLLGSEFVRFAWHKFFFVGRCVGRCVGWCVGFVFSFARLHAFLLQFGSAFCLVRDIRSLLFGSEFVGCECHDEFVLWFGS